jgi:non-ribosomal peptide synthase protein (TIGR01720 family)
LAYWKGVVDVPPGKLTGRSPGTNRDCDERTLVLPPELTRPLLTTVPAGFHATVADVLLTGLALALRGENGENGGKGENLLIMLEGHGREEHLVAGADLSRTVGWFTSEYPVRLDLGGEAPAEALKTIKERLRAIPDNGVGYGLLRWSHPDTAAVLAGYEKPAIGFNYLGRFAAGDAEDGPWEPAGEGWGGGADDDMPADYPLEINATAEDHPDGPRLVATFTWSRGLLTAAEVDALAGRWRDALSALTEGEGGHTPSDLDLVELSQDDIDLFEADFASDWETL